MTPLELLVALEDAGCLVVWTDGTHVLTAWRPGQGPTRRLRRQIRRHKPFLLRRLWTAAQAGIETLKESPA
jgi:hypothetical protein